MMPMHGRTAGSCWMDSDGTPKRLPRTIQALAIRPDDAVIWFVRGNALNADKQFGRAVESYDRVTVTCPENADAWFARGNAFSDLNRHAEAIDSYDRAVAIRPDYAGAWFNRGTSLQKENAVRGGCRFVRTGQFSFPRKIRWCGTTGGPCSRNSDGMKKRSGRLTGQLPSGPADTNAWIGRGNALHKDGRCREAVDSFDQALAISPGSAIVWNNRGNALNDLERPLEAVESYDKAVAISPDYANAWFNHGIGT